NFMAPWWVTLSRHNLSKEEPKSEENDLIFKDHSHREDLTHLDFITIDSINTKDIDDALFIEKKYNGDISLTVAIADPT
ncbi:MAG: RNB domain-containing ribonuclease, partial [Buchnera aphidicola]|nr:RNB domain-containing ribonuclease [Buchnera aphidicola]